MTRQHLDPEAYAAVRRALGEKTQFIQGDEACAYGALLAGCRYFAGYPITPATETAETMARLLPRIGGCCIQMEDEIASISAIIGASWAGVRAMTATSGPGFSLMQENIGYACMTETPCVIVNVQRSGPSTGQPTEAAQGDMLQTRWGTHGDHEIIALCPSTVQECLELTLESFNLSEQYRNPVVLLTDGDVGHMRERVVIPEREEYEVDWRVAPPEDRQEYIPFAPGADGVPRLADFGHGYRTYVTGLTHDERGMPATDDAVAHTRLVTHLCDKISSRREELARVVLDAQEGARLGLISYGISARPTRAAVRLLRAAGVPASYLRLITVWPFPERQVAELAAQVDEILVPEMNLGQMVHPVREAAQGRCRVTVLPKIGGVMHTPAEIVAAAEGLLQPASSGGAPGVREGVR